MAHTGGNYMEFTNGTDGRNVGLLGRFYGWFPPSWHNSGPLTNQPFVGTEYELSCYVKGTGIGAGNWFGFWDELAPADPDNPTCPHAFRIPIPSGEIPDWTKISGVFRYEGCKMQWGSAQNTVLFEYQILLQNVVGRLDVDDYYLGFARGTMHFLSPDHYMHYNGSGGPEPPSGLD